jgi:hypothetical protein
MYLIYSIYNDKNVDKKKKRKSQNLQTPRQVANIGNGSNLNEPLLPASNSASHELNTFRRGSINDDDEDENNQNNQNNNNNLINTNNNNKNEDNNEDELFEDIYEEKDSEKKENYLFFKLILKTFFYHLDKMTLIVMYFVSVYTVNIVHVVLVFIFMLQIISPSKINIILLIILIVLQLLFLFEFIVDLLKVYYINFFKDHEELMNLLLLYDNDINSNKLEIFLYAVIYSFHFQYKIYNYTFIKNLLNDNNLNLKNIINNKYQDSPKTKKFFAALGSFILKLYFWILVAFFIFFSCYFELNLLFGIKLLLFFILFYQFLTTIEQPKERKCLSKIINWIFLL